MAKSLLYIKYEAPWWNVYFVPTYNNGEILIPVRYGHYQFQNYSFARKQYKRLLDSYWAYKSFNPNLPYIIVHNSVILP